MGPNSNKRKGPEASVLINADFHPQRKGSFFSGSRRLCRISSKSVKNCDRESENSHYLRRSI